MVVSDWTADGKPTLIFELTASGKILSFKTESDDGENLSNLCGFDFVDMVSGEDAAKAAKFISALELEENVGMQGARAVQLRLIPKPFGGRMHKVLGFKNGNLYLVIQDVQPAANLDALLLSMRQRMGALFDNLPIALLIAAHFRHTGVTMPR